nr:L-threonylcarbamoyladenylate synthase [Microlunatus panaciterrae]
MSQTLPGVEPAAGAELNPDAGNGQDTAGADPGADEAAGDRAIADADESEAEVPASGEEAHASDEEAQEPDVEAHASDEEAQEPDVEAHASDEEAQEPDVEAYEPDEEGYEPDEIVAYQRYDCTSNEDAAIEAAAEAARSAIERGECIVLPTDTVYGIGADAFSSDAVQSLLDAKGRGRDMPPPVLIAEPSLIRALAVDVPAAAKALVEAYWPGPLTVICKAQPSLQMDLGDTQGTVALRVPDHDLARTLLRRTGPMAVSSANRSGQPAALSCDEAIQQLGDAVAVYLDGGPLGGDGAPSTIVDFSIEEHGVILRRGALSIETLRQHCPDIVDLNPPAEEPLEPAALEEPASLEQPGALEESDAPEESGQVSPPDGTGENEGGADHGNEPVEAPATSAEAAALIREAGSVEGETAETGHRDPRPQGGEPADEPPPTTEG